jgi:hypothetical protein
MGLAGLSVVAQKIVLACAGLRGAVHRDHECMWIVSFAALRGTGLVEIMSACESPAWQALEVWSNRDGVSLWGGSLGEIWQAFGAWP